MKRWTHIRTRALRLALWGALGPVALGCVDNGGSLIIVEAQEPTMIDNRFCAVPEKRGTRRSDGILDVGLDQDYPYYLLPLVANLMPTIGRMGKDVEPNRIEITGARIRIEPPPGVPVPWQDTCPAQFDYAGQLQLEPAAEGSLKIEAVRACHAKLFRDLFERGQLDPNLNENVRFRLIVRAKGKHGGVGILSDPFEFPLRVCYGCLQTGFPDPEFAQFNFPQVPNCAKLFVNPYKGNPCNPAQDIPPILCCARDGRKDALECPGLPRGQRAMGMMP